MPTAAAIIAQRLALAGCRHAFGVPGGEVLTLIDALAGAGITFHLTRHENAAGFMAEGTWQATGAPGILVATLGPGVTNGLTAVANALQERVPLIVLTGRIGAGAEQGFTHQIIDHGAVMGPLVKASFTAAAGTVDLCIDKALAIATDGQPGPVHIDLPLTLAA
ncbi:MAG: thiamine pyrophosphate-binding protein, partial [Rhodobacterales bacterium]|nr:thiamine pyrophosphate-binding protein [Rhodobacterales bacterium]